jgi:hypothetical protein
VEVGGSLVRVYRGRRYPVEDGVVRLLGSPDDLYRGLMKTRCSSCLTMRSPEARGHYGLSIARMPDGALLCARWNHSDRTRLRERRRVISATNIGSDKILSPQPIKELIMTGSFVEKNK